MGTKYTNAKNRIISFILSFVMILGLIPATTLDTFAVFSQNSMMEAEITDTSLMTKSGGHWVSNYETFDNYSTDITVDGDTFYKVSGAWYEEYVLAMLDKGIVLGIETEGADKKNLIPTTALAHGNDALAIALFYYWGSTKNGFVTYSGARSRQDTYDSAAEYFSNATGINKTFARNIAGNLAFKRYEGFTIIAYCIEKRSGGRIKLAQYSDTEFGKMANKKTYVNNIREGSGGLEIRESDGGWIPLADVDTVKSCNATAIQAINMLIDVGTLNGARNQSDSVTKIKPNDGLTYAEFYKLLYYVDMNADSFEPTEYSEIDAKLTVTAGDSQISYRDFLDGASVRVNVTLNASKTQSLQPIKKYDYEVSDGANDNNASVSSSSKTFGFTYSASDLGFTEAVSWKNKGEVDYRVSYSGSVEVTDKLGETDTASDTNRGTISVVNYAPNAYFTAKTNSLEDKYASLFFHINDPITLTDGCSDYENALAHRYYVVKRSGSNIAVSADFGNEDKIDRFVREFKGDATIKTHTLTFSQPGTYTIECYCSDEMGKLSSTYSRTIYVSGEPAPPTAKISANDYTYMNYDTKFTDASTDPNDDIVEWKWTPQIEYFEEVLDENGDSTGEGEWIPAVPGTHYTGSLNDQTRNINGSYTTAAGTLQFKVYGTFRIHLTVTDVTGLSDTTYHDIEILENIPVIIVDDDPNPPQTDVEYTVTFINTDNTQKQFKVKAGEYIPGANVPAIVDVAGIYEHGWTQDGLSVVEPTTVKVMGNLTFVVLTTPEDSNKNIHTVTFINTDGTRVSVKVPHGGSIASTEIPAIVDETDLKELGWTDDGNTVVDPAAVVVERDIVFWVKTEPIERDTHKIIFINTDGTVDIVEVLDGDPIKAEDVPDIVDLPDMTENGWTNDNGETIVDPVGIVPTEDMVFIVDVDRDDDTTHTVTFLNTDNSVTKVTVPHMGNIPADDVPDIVDLKDITENGWTMDGETIVIPTDVAVDRDLLFWVDYDETSIDRPEDGRPYFDDLGRLVIKQNRSAVIDTTPSLSPPTDPIQSAKTEWELISVDGYDLDNVKFSGGTASGLKATFLAKEPGEFKVKVTLHNNYSDSLADRYPNSTKLQARTTTITVVVYPDEPPEVELFVNNANPDFHNNPTSTDVTVASSASSPDGDSIGNYDWSITRDENENGKYEEKAFYEKSGSTLPTVTFPVQFKSGVSGGFLAELTVTENPGQSTLTEYMDKEDYLTASTEKEFDVNWTPCISYDFELDGNQWAYVDDIITIKAKVLDENTSTCKVNWTLKKKINGSYVTIEQSALPVWDFGTLGGKIMIPVDGYYVMEAVITDERGNSETFVSNEIRIYDLPTAVISDVAEYRWGGVQWLYKQSRRFDINGNASYADDGTGKALHEITHASDVWSITPLGDGAVADAIYVLADDDVNRLESEDKSYFRATKNVFDEQVAIIEPGTYLITYQVTNTYGKKSPTVTQVITITEDLDPEIVVKDGNKQEPLGSEADDRYTTVGNITATLRSTDKDIVYSANSTAVKDIISARYRYDSNNDGSYEDETWVELPVIYGDTTEIINSDTGLFLLDGSNEQSTDITVKARVNQLGWYQFELQVHEQFGQETLPILPDSVYKHFTTQRTIEVDNASPNGMFDIVNNVYADIVFAFGGYEEGQKTINKETAFTFGSGGNQLDAESGQQAITLQPNEYVLEVYGARGGSYTDDSENTYSGGNGAYVKTNLTITEPTTLYVTVGGRGSQGTGSSTAGYNGGGSVGTGSPTNASGGGGASMIALAPGLLGEVDSNKILVVASGGGGAINGEDGKGGEGLTTNHAPNQESLNSEDNYSAGGGGGYQSGEAGVTEKREVSYYDTWIIRELSCKDEVHEHVDSCYETTSVLSCATEAHEHSDDCHTITYQTDCGVEAHTHTDDCYINFGFGKTLICSKTVHTHSVDCYTTKCDSDDPNHIHDESCYILESDEITCGKTEHTHGSSCYTTKFVTECGLPEHVHTSSCRRGPSGYRCGYEAHTHTTDCYNLICGKTAHTHGIDCYQYYNYVGEAGHGGYSYANDALVTGTEVKTDNWPQSGYVKIAYYTEETINYSSSEYNEELLQKNANFAGMFGEVPGANLFQLNVSTVETSAIDFAEGINWNTSQMSSSIGSVTVTNGGLSVLMQGNRCNAGQNMVFCPDYKGEITFGFDYSLNWGDSFNGAGIVMNIEEAATEIKCTIIWIPNRGGMGQAGIYDCVYKKGYNGSTTPYNYTLLQSISLHTSGHLDLIANQGNITVSGSGVGGKTYEVQAPYHGDGFGFYSSHYSHGCSDIGQFQMDNIYLQVSERKTLADTLANTSFTVGNDTFVIWAEGTVPEELDPSSPTYAEDYQTLLQKILDSNIHLIVFGSRENQTVMEELLGSLPVEGTFANTGSVDGDLEAARDFIAAILRQRLNTNVKYVLVGEDSVYEKYYADYNGHEHWYATGDEDNIYSSRWWYLQDADYFANSLGLISDNATWRSSEITNFDKVGKFYVDYRVKDNAVPDAYADDNSTNNPFDGDPDRHLTDEELAEDLRHGYRYWSSNYAGVDDLNAGFMYDNDRDIYDERLETTLKTSNGEISNQPAEIFVHRRPTAESVGVSVIGANDILSSITITDSSYDIDHNDPDHASYTATKGLQQYEWTYYWYEGATLKNHEKKLFLDVDDGVAWINKMASQYPYTANTDIKVLYRVRDIDGVTTTETTTYELTLQGVLYAAPELSDCDDLTALERKTANSYRYAVTSEDIPGIPAGTYVTQSYDEAIYVLKVDEEHKLERYNKATSEYNAAVNDRKAKETSYNDLETAAKTAEKLRDDQEKVVSNWRTTQETKKRLLDEAKATLTTRENELAAAQATLAVKQTALDEATAAYTAAESAYNTASSELATLEGNISRLTGERDTLQSELTRLNGELASLRNELAALEQEETPDEEAIAAKNAAITAKEAEIAAKETSLSTKQTELDDMVNAKPAKENEVAEKTAAMASALASKQSAQSDYDAAAAAVASAQNAVKSQQAVVDKYTSEESSANNRYFSELKKYNELKSSASTARSKANSAKQALDAAKQTEASKKTAMDNAKAEYDAATAKKNAVRPLTMNATVSTTQTKDLTIPDGVWSVYESREYTSRPLKPIAKFVTDSIVYVPGQNISITDSSYSPNGNNIVKWVWTITRDGTEIGTKTYTDATYSDADVSNWVFSVVDAQELNTEASKNKYKITLVVTDDKSEPMESDSYSVTITISPTNQPPTAEAADPSTSIYRTQNPIVYEYDDYDANLNNPFYTYGGTVQKRGQEILDWTLIIDDPDNHDKYGPANDSDVFDVLYQFERLKTPNIISANEKLFSGSYTKFGPLKVTIAEALDNSKIAPFVTIKDSGLAWGAYRITTSVTDNPNNGATGKTVSIVTKSNATPRHLYVIPKLELNDIHYTWEGVVDTEEQIPVGDTMTVTFTSNNEVTSANVLMPNGEGGNMVFAASVAETLADGTKKWTAEVYVPDTVEEDDLVDAKGYTFTVEVNTNYGSDTGAITRTKKATKSMNVLAIKLFDFHITAISDPSVEYDGSDVYVKDLAFDKTNTTSNSLMKKGYAFYFELSSMGLKGANDSVRIKPSFYGYNEATGCYDIPLDVYYQNDDGEYVLGTYASSTTSADDTFRMYAKGQGGSQLGTMRELNLDDDDRVLDGKSQKWSGRYGLPNTAVFVKKGAALTDNQLYIGDVLISFSLEAMKNGASKYDYISRGQWASERLTDSGTIANAQKSLYADGSVIVIDGTKNAFDNYEALPVWRKS